MNSQLHSPYSILQSEAAMYEPPIDITVKYQVFVDEIWLKYECKPCSRGDLQHCLKLALLRPMANFVLLDYWEVQYKEESVWYGGSYRWIGFRLLNTLCNGNACKGDRPETGIANIKT